MERFVQIYLKSILLFVFVSYGVLSYAASGDYRSTKSGNWGDVSVWEVSNGTLWSAASTMPSSLTNVLIQTNHTVSIDGFSACKNLTFSNNAGNSRIDFNVSTGALYIYGDATFRDGINSIKSWVDGAKLFFKGTTDQTFTIGSGCRFYSIEIDKPAGTVTISGGNTMRLENSLMISQKSTLTLSSNINLEGVQFADGTTATKPEIKVSENAKMIVNGSTVIRSGSTGSSAIGDVKIYGTLSLTSTSATGINFTNVIVGNGSDVASLNITGVWGSGTFNFNSITVNKNANYNLSATTIGSSSNGITVYNSGSKVAYGSGASSNLPFADVDYCNLELNKTTSWTVSSDRIINGDLTLGSSAVLTLSGPAGLTSNLKKINITGNVFIDGAATLKVRHVNLNVEDDFTISNGNFEGGSGSSTSVNSAEHRFNGDVSVTNGNFKLTTTDSDPVYYIKGNISINSGGNFLGTSDAGGVPILNIQGGISTSIGGTFKATNLSSVSSTTLLNINFTNESGLNNSSDLSLATGLTDYEALWRFTLSSGRIIKLKSDIELGGNSTTAYTSFDVASGATLNTENYTIKSTSAANDTRFFLRTDAMLEIKNSTGISTSLNSGAVQTISRSFASTASYSYNGNANQATGNGLPGNVKNLIVNNSGSSGNNVVTLTNSVSIGSNSCTISNGILDVGSNSLTGTGSLIMTGGTLRLSKLSSSVLLPEITGAYSLTGGTIEFSGNGNQVARGGTYHNLKFSGTNTLGTNYKCASSTLTINNNLEISDNAILDGIDVLGNAITIMGNGGLTMSGNSRFRMKKLNATLPELTATNSGTDFSLTGGTIELYGSGATQTHSLNGTKGNASADITYYNVEINADALNSTDANVVLQSSINVTNNFVVNSPASFQVSNLFRIKGAGNFELKPGATLQFGSPDGLSSDNSKGNIRVTGSSVLPSTANYGFIGAVEMVSGDLLPDTVNNLFISKSNNKSTTLSKNLVVTGNANFKKGNIISTGTKELIISAGASVSGANDDSYVNGKVKKVGNTSFTYPVGSNGFYRPIGHSAPANVTDAFTASYYFSDPSIYGTAKDTGVDYVSECEYWILDRISGNSNVAVTLTWDDNSCGISELSSLRVVKWDGSKWRNYGNESYTSLTRTGSLTSKTVSSFSPFTLAATNTASPLPIFLLSFKGEKRNNENILKWVSASEINSDHYEIQRSLDGLNFISISNVDAARNSHQERAYEYIDNVISQDDYYYRLKLVDRDGSFSYSSTILMSSMVIKESLVESFMVKENSIEIVFSSSIKTEKSVAVYDLTGREIQNGKALLNQIKISGESMIHGELYLMKIWYGNEVLIKRFVY